MCTPHCNMGYVLEGCDFGHQYCRGSTSGKHSWIPKNTNCKCVKRTCHISDLKTLETITWSCNQSALEDDFSKYPVGTTCTGDCKAGFVLICDSGIGEATCNNAGEWELPNQCQCVKNTCGQPRMFNTRQIKIGAKYQFSNGVDGVAGIGAIVQAVCPSNSMLKCDGNTAWLYNMIISQASYVIAVVCVM